MKKHVFFWLLIIVLPLMIGLLVYLFFRQDSLIAQLVLKRIHIPAISFGETNSIVVLFIRYYLSDLMWAISLTSAMALIIGHKLRDLVIVFVIALSTEFLVEFLQMPRILTGSFDILDLLTEAVGSIISIIIIFFYYKKEKAYETQEN